MLRQKPTQILRRKPTQTNPENQDPEKPGPGKTWTLKSLDTKKRKKQLDVEKLIEDHII